MKIGARTAGLSAIIAILLATGCMSAREHYQQTHGAAEREMTVGTVQKEIRKGMSAADARIPAGPPITDAGIRDG
jgi:hypothetical protein